MAVMREPYQRAVFRVTPRFCGRDSAEGLCLRCGLHGRHVSWSDCIRQLREQTANLEIEAVKLRPAGPNERRGRPRKSGQPRQAGLG